ncbi:MAG: hypothetical protein QXV01_05165 [Candidatus Bathyarchaeia archaeon]
MPSGVHKGSIRCPGCVTNVCGVMECAVQAVAKCSVGYAGYVDLDTASLRRAK